MILLVLGLVLFLGVHSVSIVAPAWRDAQVAKRGEAAWKRTYSIVSLVGFVLLIYGYGVARHSAVVVYAPPPGLRHLSMLLMLPVFPLLAASHLPGRIRSATRHPMLLAVMFWGAAHLLANGTLADRISVARRPPVPPKGRPARAANDFIALGVGLALYGVFIAGLHRWLFGVSPLG